jgi:hypothetical protein
MDAQKLSHKSVRAGVFSTLHEADQAVSELLAAGFTKEQITVVCSDAAIERHYQEFEHQDPAGNHAAKGVVAGTSVGAVVGGLTAIAVGAASGAVPLIVAGAAGLAAGSTMGGFLGAMLSRGQEKELSNFYDQELRNGKILVAVEVHGPQAEARLAQAATIISESGSPPVPLPEG